MTGGQPYSDAVLTEDHWQILFTQAFLFATKYINRLRWRGTFGGVMPDGDDAESIATQAVIDFLQQCPSKALPLLDSRRGPGRGGHPSSKTTIHHSVSLAPLIQRSNNPTIHQVLLTHQSNNPTIQQSGHPVLPPSISSPLTRLVCGHVHRP